MLLALTVADDAQTDSDNKRSRLDEGAWSPANLAALMDVRVLHSLVDEHEQQKVLSAIKPGHMRVVLATSIAESSLTLPGLLYVIDTGLEKEMSYSEERDMSCLNTNFISQVGVFRHCVLSSTAPPFVSHSVLTCLCVCVRPLPSSARVASAA